MKQTSWRTLLVSLAAVVTVVAVSGPTAAQTADPLIGTWKLDVAKSKYSPGPAAKSSIAIFATAPGSAVKVTVDGVASTGDKTHFEYTAKYDSKDVPLTGNNPDADMISMKRISARTTESTYKLKGKVTITNTRTVSADGKTLTVTQRGTNAQGQTINNELIYIKG
jgi:hypothetical protein